LYDTYDSIIEVARKRTKEGSERKHALTSMRRIGMDRSTMKHGDRYPRVNFRVGDDLLSKIEKEIEKTGLSTSEIAKKALDEYFAKR